MKKAKEMLRDLKNVKVLKFIYYWWKIPDVYEEFSTESMIVMEFIHGIPLVDLKSLKQERYNFEEIAHTISLVFSRLLFKYGYVHSDPHQVE